MGFVKVGLVFEQEGPLELTDMLAFVILSVVAVAAAGRLGYDYKLGVPGYAPEGLVAGPSGQAAVSISNYGATTIGSSDSDFQYSGSPNFAAPISAEGGLNKEFYQYAAPEEEFYDGDASQRALSSLKRKLRVVFIKAPENNGLSDAVLQLAKQAGDDKTAIYVLSKQPDISELANQVQNLRQSVSQKPEVRFIKYRTPEDAANAQHTIQQQYDALGGTSRTSNEGLAPVLNYASARQQIGGGSDFGSIGFASNVSPIGLAESREYLPSSV